MPKLWEALITLVLMVVVIGVGIIKFGVDPHVPMFIGTIIAACMALYLGYKWEEIEKSMLDGIYRALQSCCILIIIGVLIGVWLDAGVVPAMIYYGLKILHPSIFFIAVVLICSITSLATGSSWGTMGTMGVAFMGIGLGLGMDLGMTAGAILSGAYFGDKMSPLSDTTNLAPAMAGTDVMTHVKFMMLPTGIVYAITLVFFGILGMVQYHGGNADMSKAVEISTALDSMFNINPLLLLPPVIVIAAVALKVPAIPGITLGIIAGGIIGMIFQSECTLGSLMSVGMSGFSCETGIFEIDELLNRGGIESMMFSVSMAMIATSLVTLTELTCLASNAIMPEQNISIIMPGRMYAEEYQKQGLHPKCLSNALESAGTVTSALIPWNTCGVFISTTLGIELVTYAPWAVFNWLMPIAVIVMAFMGITVCDMDGVRLNKKKKAAKV